MQVEQALRALQQLQTAAPPATSARLGEMIALIRQLEVENATLRQQIKVLSAKATTGILTPQAFDMMRPSMMAVRGNADALVQGKFGGVTTEQAESIKVISEHATTALALMDSLDMIGRLRDGKLQIEPKTFSGLDLLAGVWQRHATAAEPREHRINIKADDPLPTVKGDYKHVLNILSDLVDNAIRYTPFGGVIRVTAETLGTHVLFTVADNGIGLTEEDTSHIGKPFWRAARQPLVRQHPGTGLKLYLARQVLAMHGSDLFLSGEPGVGSSFSFMLAAG